MHGYTFLFGFLTSKGKTYILWEPFALTLVAGKNDVFIVL